MEKQRDVDSGRASCDVIDDPRRLWDLPDEILFTIFSYLSPIDLCRICRVCRRFNLLASVDYLWMPTLRKTFVVDPQGKLNPEPRKNKSLKDKLRVAHRWRAGQCTRSVVVQHRVKLLPCLQYCGSQLWASNGPVIRRYDVWRNGSLVEKVPDRLQFHKDKYRHGRRCRTSRKWWSNEDVTRFVCKDEYVVAGNCKGEVCAWEKDTGKQLSMFADSHRGEVNCVDIINGYILSGSRDGTVRLSPLIGDDKNGQVRPDSVQCLSLNERVWSIAASPDGSQFVTGAAGCVDSTSPLVLWDFTTARQLVSFESSHRMGAGVLDVKFESPNCILTCGYDTYLKLWDLRTPSTCAKKWVDPHDLALYCLDSDGDRALVAGGSRHGMVRLWDKRADLPVQSYFNGRMSSPVYSIAMDASRVFLALDLSITQIDFSYF